MSKSIKQLRENRAELLDKMELLVRTAKADDRDMTTSERDSFETMDCQLRQLDRELEKLETDAEAHKAEAIARARAQREGKSYANPQAGVHEWRTIDGKPVYALGKGAKWSDLPHLADDKRYEGVKLGDVVRCMITGKGTSEVKAALSEGANTSGGFLVPEQLQAQVYDYAFALSVVGAAGVMRIPMTSETMTVAKVTGAPTTTVKAENVAWTASDATFGAVNFTSKTAGGLSYVSRELAEDAVDFPDVLTRTWARSLADYLDFTALRGDGTSTYPILGVLNYPAINTSAVSGAISWAAMNTAVSLIRSDNREPTSYIASPTIMGDLATLTSGDAVNAASMWQGPPPTVAPLMALHTSNMPDTDVIVADWAQSAWGIRTEPLIEITREAGDTFVKHQLGIKISWRGDFQLLDPEAFCSLTGVTT